jgi:hypothetical protein
MARKVFYSFHYELDSWRVSQVKKMGQVEGQPILQSNQWEDVEAGGDAAIQKWIDAQMIGKSCNVVLIGHKTAGRKWVNYELKKAWGDGKGLLGIHIHNLLDSNGQFSVMGSNPFSGFTINDGKVALDSVVPVKNPAGKTSTEVYATIRDNIEAWVEDAIAVRKQW